MPWPIEASERTMHGFHEWPESEAEMNIIEYHYFKSTFEEGPIYISGFSLPNPNEGPYKFIDCDFHPRLDDDITNNYRGSIIVISATKLMPQVTKTI